MLLLEGCDNSDSGVVQNAMVCVFMPDRLREIT